jgi:predicted MFS family arabinose efflux permease
MNKSELQLAGSVAFIFFCRMMGLFMVLPILSLYGNDLEGASFALVGLALGVYGLSQAFLQIPFAMLSDVYGRKRIMLFGLFLFLLGSVCASFADNIWSLILSRFLQGAGAIAGTSMALLADRSSEEARARVMALVGIAIGASFVMSLILGPVIAGKWGLSGVFILSSILALLAIFVCWAGIKESPVSHQGAANSEMPAGKHKVSFTNVLEHFNNKKVVAYVLGVFVLHMVMTASFIVIPLILEQQHGVNREGHWKVYLGVFLIALLMMGPLARPSSDVSRLSWIFQFSSLLMIVSMFSLAFFFGQYYAFLALLCFFFFAFNLMEALLPSMLSLEVGAEGRASAMGLFSSFQFLGAFCGGLLSGLMLEYLDYASVFVSAALWVLIVLLFFLNIKPRPSLKTNS